MAFAYIFPALIILLLIGGPILAIIAFRRATALQEALGRANARIESLEARLADHPPREAPQPRPRPTEAAPEADAATSSRGEPVSEPHAATPSPPGLVPEPDAASPAQAGWASETDAASPTRAGTVSEPDASSPTRAGWTSAPDPADAWKPKHAGRSTPRDAATSTDLGDPAGGLEHRLTSRWLVWLGGVTIALAGIFLVKYSIDQDWLNPSVRCALGALGGVALAIAGEWVRRRPLQRAMEIVEPGVIPPALSAAGVAMLYSSVYAAFALYDLIGALFAFVVLAVVSFASFALALLQGRFIAVLGLVGGYLVPALVSTGEGSAPALFSFLGVLAVALTVIVRYRGWWEIAWLGLAGATAWPALWLAAQWTPADAPVLGGYLAALAALFLYVRPVVGTERRIRFAIPILQADAYLWVSAAATAMLVFSLVQVDGFGPVSFVVLAVMSALFLHAGYRAERYDRLGAVALVAVLAVFATWDVPAPMDSDGRALGEQGWLYDLGLGSAVPPLLAPYASLGAAFAALFGLAGFLALRRAKRPWVWAAVSAGAPVALLAVGFWRIQLFAIHLQWAVAGLGVAALLLRAAVQVARDRDRPGMPGALAVYAMGVVAALSLAMAMSLEQAWLTVALSLQIPALAAIHDRLPLVGLRRTAWIVAGVVMSRLVLNYQVFDYSLGLLPGLGWTIYGYGLPCVGFWYAARRFRTHGDAALVRFLEAGALAFGVLLVSLQIRFWTAGDIGAATYSFTERSLQTVAWLAIAYGLYLRSDGSARDTFTWGWRVLGAVAAAQLVVLQVLGGPLWRPIAVGDYPVTNLLLLAYGLPALFAALLFRAASSRRSVGDRRIATIAGIAVLVLIFIEVSLEVRRAFHGSILVSGQVDGAYHDAGKTSNAEWYAYSVAWLMYAGVLLALGIRRMSSALRYASLALVMLTTAKLFVFDMSELTGLFRVVSFLGLGLSLIGVGYLYQRFVFPPRTSNPTPAG